MAGSKPGVVIASMFLLCSMEMPVPIQTNRFVNPYYREQLKEVPYTNSYVPACSDFGTQFQDHGFNNYFKNSNTINMYSHSSCDNRSTFNIEEDEAHLLELGQNCPRYGDISQSSGLHIGETRLASQEDDNKLDPYSPLCMVPLPGHLIETNFIRRRNERERERVRCVNEGYDRLKEHLPLEHKDRRISKVETLRRAIEYIRELQSLLDETEGTFHTLSNTCSDDALLSERRKT